MPTAATTPVVYRAREVAEALGISVRVARRVCREHGLRIGPRLLCVTPAGLAEYLSRRDAARPPPPPPEP